MSTPDFSALVVRHRAYFRTGATRSAEWREGQLTALRAMMTDRAEDFHAALSTDLRRNRTDADLTDVKFLAAEADHALSRLRQWMKPLSVSTPPALGPARVQVQFDPGTRPSTTARSSRSSPTCPSAASATPGW